MSKNKIAKLLLTLGIGVVTATSGVIAAGCNNTTPDGDSNTHTHTYGDYVTDGESGHHRDCIDGDDTQTEEHTWGEDNTCTKCGEQKILTHADYVAVGSDDINNDTTVPAYGDVIGEPAQVAAPKVVAKTGDGPALTEGSNTAKSELLVETAGIDNSAGDWTNGMFTLTSGTTIDSSRNKTGVYVESTQVDSAKYTGAIKLGGSADKLSIEAVGAGTWTVYVQNGSSNSDTQTMIFTDPQGHTTDITYPGNSVGSTIQKVEITIPAAGKYSLSRTSGTSWIYYSCVEAEVENTAIQSIVVVNTGKTDYLVGQQLDCTGIAVNAVHADTGRYSTVDNAHLTVDTSKFNPNEAGVYEIGITYTVAGNLGSSTTTFNTTYNVNVYDYDGLELGYNKILKGSNSAAGNSIYVNHAVKQFYFKGESFSTDGLSVKGIGKLGATTKAFILDEAQAVVTGSTATVGKNTVKVEYTLNGVTKAKGFNIYVAEKPADIATADQIILAVNPAFSTATIGTKNAAGAYRFKTIQQAIDFLNASGAKSSAAKTMYIAEGTYWEKLEVTVPNLTIVGAGADKTKIEYDSLYGVQDESGFEHTTDSTATLNIRDGAKGFTIKDATISNAYNSLKYFDDTLGAGYSEHRALAMLIQADKVVIDNCKILGYQDTIELFTGRQLITNTYISGTTDFIFGTNNTTYFYNCTIHSISSGKQDGGYITAFKGCNKGDTDYVTYGAIFDKCNFTADADVVANGNTAIGRPWGAYAAVAVINSTLAGHISKTCSGSASKNERYVAMSGVNPTVATAKFVEYNNSGAGAITEAVPGMKMLTSTEAANYSNLSVIFGKTNGKLTYTDVWDITLG